MPRKTQIHKNTIIDAAIDLIKSEGTDSFTTRKISAKINCSTQPIYSQFKSIKELENAVTKKIYDIMVNDYLLSNENEDPFLRLCIGYVEFARKERNLFKYLYISGKNLRLRFENPDFEISMVKRGNKMDQLDIETLKIMYEKLSLFKHGLALIMNQNPNAFTENQITELVVEAIEAFSYFEKNKWGK
ncbi:TetR/AcrR family transcriptional regulator [Mycoplasmatota bacterium]|nr:TetR/AcrR family transcriptional regulator [Mycoplasmatota bacterium]